jgi:lysophospholipase L1-like esterase
VAPEARIEVTGGMNNYPASSSRYRHLVATYLILLHLALTLLVVNTSAVAGLLARLGDSAVQPDPYVGRMQQHQRWMDVSVPSGAVIFLGDSITQSLATAAVAPNTVNYGIGSATTSDLIGALPDYRSLERASAIVLTIGINDLIRAGSEGLPDRFRQIATSLPPGVPLIWNAVMPVAPHIASATLVVSVNQAIAAECKQRPRCTFVDTAALLGEPGGSANEGVLLADGLHLSPAGYRLWIDALAHAIAEIPRTKIVLNSWK